MSALLDSLIRDKPRAKCANYKQMPQRQRRRRRFNDYAHHFPLGLFHAQHKVVVVRKMMRTFSTADPCPSDNMEILHWIEMSHFVTPKSGKNEIALFKIKMPFNCGNKVQSCLFILCVYLCID